MPYLTRYNSHKTHTQSLHDEYAIISNTHPKSQITAAIHDIVAVHDLPRNIARVQQRAVEKLAYECERKAYIRCTKNICLNCEYKGKPSGIRLCTLTKTFLCQNKCEGKPPHPALCMPTHTKNSNHASQGASSPST